MRFALGSMSFGFVGFAALADGQVGTSRLYLQRPVEAWAHEALADTSPRLAARGILALRRMGPQAQDAMPLLESSLRSDDGRARIRALRVLSAVAPTVVPPLADMIATLRDTSATQVVAALRVLPFFGTRAAAAAPEVTKLLADRRPLVRGQAATALASIAPTSVLDLAPLLNDPDAGVRVSVLGALSRVGSFAAPLIPAIARRLQDSSATVARLAAAAANSVMGEQSERADKQRPGVTMILAGDYSLQNDGEATYVDGMDGAQVIVAGALHLLAKKACDIKIGNPDLGGCETQMLTIPIGGPNARSITFDFRRPIPGSGSKNLGLVRDFEGAIDVFWKVDPNRPRTYLMMRNMPVGQTEVPIERVSLNVAIEGHPHILQFGSWGTGQFYSATPQASGKGTTGALVTHASPTDWVVRSVPNSVGRLWDVADPDHPVDLGLYSFSFALRFMELADK